MRTKVVVSLGASAALAISSLVPVTTNAAVSAPAAGSSVAPCPLTIAHRGGIPDDHKDIPENSMPGFERAARIGMWANETDIQFTKDGVGVIMHDTDSGKHIGLHRTTTGEGLVRDHTYDYIKNLHLVTNHSGQRVVTKYRVPTFQQVLDFSYKHSIGLVAEYKDRQQDHLFKTFLDQIKASKARVMVGGFSVKLMEYVHKHAPKMSNMWFVNGLYPVDAPAGVFGLDPAQVPAGANVGMLNIKVDAAYVKKMNDAGIQVNTWYNSATKGDDPTGWEPVTMAGVKWISTDYPVEYRAWEKSQSVCQSRGKTTQRTVCVHPPKRIPAGKGRELLPGKCETSALLRVKVKVTTNKPGVAKVTRFSGGRVKIKSTGKSGRIKVKYSTPSTKYFKRYNRVERFKVS